MDIKKEVFDIFQQEHDKYRLYERIIKFAEELVKETKGKENAKFYKIISKLHEDINNVGWEERHSEIIHYIWGVSHNIVEKYDDYLD